MKKIALTLVLAASFAQAEEWWETTTTTGGKIVLTTQTADWCGKGAWVAYIETTKQDSIYGCWVVANDRIHVRYNSGITKVYDKDGWDYKTDGKK